MRGRPRWPIKRPDMMLADGGALAFSAAGLQLFMRIGRSSLPEPALSLLATSGLDAGIKFVPLSIACRFKAI